MAGRPGDRSRFSATEDASELRAQAQADAPHQLDADQIRLLNTRVFYVVITWFKERRRPARSSEVHSIALAPATALGSARRQRATIEMFERAD